MILGTAVAIQFGARCEPSIRIVGLVFQLFGVGTVIRGISATRRLFGLEGFFAPLRQFLQRRPPWHPSTVEMSGRATLGRFTGRAQASLWMNAGPDDPIEKRITALEQNLSDVNSRLSQLLSETNKRFGEMAGRQGAEKAEVDTRMKQIETRMKTASTGGIYLSMIGAFWIALGIILSTIPSELCYLFCKQEIAAPK